MCNVRSCATDDSPVAVVGLSSAPARWLLLLALLGAGLLGGCTTFGEGFARVDRLLAAGDLAAARAGHDKLSYPARDRALQALNRGMLLRLGGDFAGSNAALESAKTMIEDLSRLSLREQATGLVTNDELRAYEGQVHERIYLQLFKAVNYLQLGDLLSARVEVLQLDLLMRELAANDARAVERAAPFARYLSGLIYDALDEPSDAMIAFRQAVAAYRERDGATAVPADLKRDVLRLSRRLGLDDEYATYRSQFGEEWTDDPAADHGELVALVFDGLAPTLREESVIWPQFGGDRLFRISLPAVAYRHSPSVQPQLFAAERKIGATLVDDLTRLVRADLEARLPAMAARAVARQALKQGAATAATRAAQKKADKAGEQLAVGILSLGMQVAAVLSERADTRNWSTLPGRVWMIRLALPAGRHTLRLEAGGRREDFPAVRVAAGATTFIAWHPLGPGGALGIVQ